MKGNIKYLLKNTGLLFISNFSSKILVFLLVPFYTSILTTEEYGLYDLLYNTIQILMPVLTLNILDAIVRFSISADKLTQKKTFSISVRYAAASLPLIACGVILLRYLFPDSKMHQYTWECILLYAAFVFQQLTSRFARGIDDIKGVSIGGILGTVVLIGANLYFLLWAKKGLVGYFYANILALMVPAAFLFVRNRMHRYIQLKDLDRNYEKELLRYSVPLIFTTLSWYINNVSDRYVVTLLCGLSANGIYSVSYKIPAILNTVQTIFIQAWQLSGIREYGTEEGNRFIRQVYAASQSGMVLICSGVIILTKFLAGILFVNEFYEAWQYVPTLLIYIVFNMLSGTVGVVFSAVKDTKAFSISAMVGAITNLLLNFLFVFWWGVEGAAIATVVSSVVIWGMRMYYARKYIDLQLNKPLTALQFVLITVQAAIMTLVTGIKGYLIQGVIILALLGIAWYQIKPMIKSAMEKRK